MTRVLVTGGCGFIGSALVRHLVRDREAHVTNIDALTYAATEGSLAAVAAQPNYRFVHGDIGDLRRMRSLLADVRPQWIFHLAAESHVDRSIEDPLLFVRTNVMGTAVLLEAAAEYFDTLSSAERDVFRCIHASTDEVFGPRSLEQTADEETPYRPSSPYAASKASADHVARAWQCTYGLPVIVTRCCNNYGPYQFPEKLIPLVTLRAAKGDTVPVYGTGENRRDWMFVEDHVQALVCVAERAEVGATYCLAGGAECRNIDIVHAICDLLDRRLGPLNAGARRSLIRLVPDRPGHDFRYGMDNRNNDLGLGWKPSTTLQGGLAQTVAWYLDNPAWWEPLLRREIDALGRHGLGRHLSIT
jgi:dTDP-glucose 4,6-dehydratase